MRVINFVFTLAETTADGWRPGIGDPTFMGWFTVLAYCIAAGLCFRAHRVASALPKRTDRKAARLWCTLAIVFAVLAVNKQLDLQSWFTSVGRSIARSGGWYGERQTVQTAFIAILAIAGCAAIAWLLWTMRSGWRSYGLALLGATFIIVFIIIRAASFHHVDELLGFSFLGVRMNWIFELSGIACVAISAARSVNPTTQREIATKHTRPYSEPVSSQTMMDNRQSFQWMVQRLRTERKSNTPSED